MEVKTEDMEVLEENMGHFKNIQIDRYNLHIKLYIYI